ncbi:hypothetical protein MMC25_000335 [Agyrium rufum]|nr:hypothetical protein [Agyrium rufum]
MIRVPWYDEPFTVVKPPTSRSLRHPELKASSPYIQRRPFSRTQQASAVLIAANPRKDDSGEEMVVDITPRAAKRLREIQQQDHNPSLALRVTVQSGGCHGFQYLMSLTNLKDQFKNVSEDAEFEDTIFETPDVEGGKARVVMDEASLELLKGSSVDYTMELIGSQFKIVGNPAASSSCGCGTSFDIKS